jgi:hypothetical protein
LRIIPVPGEDLGLKLTIGSETGLDFGVYGALLLFLSSYETDLDLS